jgi:hypothetical protein
MDVGYQTQSDQLSTLFRRTVAMWPYLFILVSLAGFAYRSLIAAAR